MFHKKCLLADKYASIITNGELIQPGHLRLQSNTPLAATTAEKISLLFEFTPEELSYDLVIERLKEWAMQQSGNNKSAAARLLQTSRKLFY